MNNFYQNLKALIFLAVFVGCTLLGQAQSINNYIFSSSNTASLNRSYGSLIDDIDMNQGSTILIGGSSTQNPNPEITTGTAMPFDFFINGNRLSGTTPASSYWVSANGWLFLGTSPGSATAFSTSFVGASARIAPFLGSMGTSAIGRIRSKTIGTQPNRVLVIEYYRMVLPYNFVTDDSSTFQVRLYESNSAIEFVYGRMENRAGTNQSYNIGIHLGNTSSASYYQHVNTTTMTASTTVNTANSYAPGLITALSNSTPGSQRSLMWVPDPPDDVTAVTFSNVTSTGMTLNWTSPSNEKGIAIYRSTDGINYTNVLNLVSNTITSWPFTGLIANTTYYWRVYSYREGVSAPVDAFETTLPASKFFTTATGNWSDPNIWNTLAVPGSQDSAEISLNDTVTLDFSGFSCGTLVVKGKMHYGATGTQSFTVNGNVIVESTGTFTAGTGTGGFTPHTLNIGGTSSTANLPGSLIVNGTLDLQTTNNVLVNFMGSQNATVTGSGPVCELPFITCNKGVDSTSILEFLRTYTQASVTPTQTGSQRLQVSSGTLKISAPVVTTSFFNAGVILINGISPAFGKLWLNHPGISLGVVPGLISAQSVTLNRGDLVIDNGSITTGTGSGTFTVNQLSSIRLNGGTLTHFGTLSVPSINTSALNIYGGDLVLDPQGNTNLSTFTPVLNIQSLATFNFTAGTITIVDPHQAAGTSSSIQIIAGGTKSVTGGTFIIGSDASTTAGPVVSTTSGFGLNIGIPIHNLTINNKGNTINTRYARLLADLTVNNTLTFTPNSYLSTGAGATGFALIAKGAVVNNGVLSGVMPGNTIRSGRIDFAGTSAQAVTGSGVTSYLTTRIANSAGVTFSNTGTWAMEKITLETGNVTNSASAIQLGSTDYSGTVVIGGLNESTSAGSFSTLPTINTTFGNMSYVYGPASNTLQTGSFNEMGAGAQSLSSLTINDLQGVTANRNLTVAQTLTLTEGKLNMGNNTLTVGTSIAVPGSLSRTNGFVVLGSTGVFTRWFSTTNPAYSYNNGFPISSGTNDRSVLINTTGSFTTGYNLSVRHDNVLGYTDIIPPFSDGISIDRRANSSWVITSSSTPSFTGTFNLRIIGAGIGALTDPQQLRLITASGVLAGTSVAGGGTTTAPQVNKDYSQIQLLGLLSGSTSIYIGTNSGVNPLSPTITAINTGNWNDVNTWEAGIIPTITNNAVIATGVTVTIPASYTATCNGLTISAGATLEGTAGGLNNAGSLIVNGTMNNSGTNVSIVSTAGTGITVNSGGTVTVSGGTVNLGPSGGSNRKFTLDGTLTVSGGTLNVNGTLVANAGSTFNQSGGDINIDGSDGTAAGSAAQGEHLLSFPGPSPSTINCSGGTITIVDPPYAGHSSTSTYALRIFSSIGSLSSFTGTHTLKLGDGASTTSGNANGFIIDTKRSSGRHPLQNVIVNGGNTTGRWTTAAVTSGAGTHIKGSMIVNASSEFRHTVIAATLAIGGNITNNGTFTMAAPLILGGEGYVITNAQTIDGSGTFRNSATSSTGAFTSLSLSNGTGLTLNTTNTTFGITGTLSLNDLKITTNNNTIVTTASGLNRGTGSLGYIVGKLGKNITTGTNNAYTFEIGTASNYLPVTVTYPSVTTAGVIAVGINSGLHPQLSASCLNAAKVINRYWTLTNTGTVTTGGNYTFNFLSGDVLGGANLALAKTFIYNGTTWDGGLMGSGSTTTYTLNGLNQYGDVSVGEITPVPASVTISTVSNNVCTGTNVQFTANVVNGGSAPTYQWKVNGSNVSTSSTYSSSTLNNGDQVTCDIVSNSPCVAVPGATSNTITMTVSPLTVGGDVSGGSTICSGSNSGVLTLSGHTGSVVRWQYAVSPFSTYTDTAITTTTFISRPLTQTTRFRAVVKSGACSEAFSDTTQVIVDAPSNAGSIGGNSSVCSGSSAGNLTVSGHVGSVVRWESATDAAFSLNFSSTITTLTTFSAGSPTQTTYFRVVVKNGSCAEATGTAHVVTVTPSSVGGSVGSSQTICSGGTPSALNLTGHVGSVVRWESSANASFTSPVTIPLSAGLTSLTPSPTSTTYYRAVVQNGSCAVVNSSAALITVNTAPGGGSITGPANVCTGTGPGNLQLTGHTGTIVQWQTQTALTAPAWTNTGSSGNPYNPGNLTQSTKYRVELSNSGCANGYSNELSITVDAASVAGSLAGTSSVCSGSTAGNITLSGHTGTVRDWLVQVLPASTYSLVTPQNTTTTQSAGSPTAETRYKAIVKNGTCNNDTTPAHIISIIPGSVGGSVSPATATVCVGNTSGLLTVSGHTGTIVKWQYAQAPGFVYTDTAITTASFTSGPLAVTTRFRAVISNGGCANANSAYAEITVNSAATAGTLSNLGASALCQGSTGPSLQLSGNTGTIVRWESAYGPAFAPFATISGATSATYATGTLNRTTDYRVVVSTSGCPEVTSNTIRVQVDSTSLAGSASTTTTSICSGSTPAQISLTGTIRGSVTRWESSSVSPFTVFDPIPSSATSTYQPGALTTTTHYRAVVANGACSSATSASVGITVTSGSVAGTVSGSTPVCSGSSTTLTLTGNTGVITTWESATSPFTVYTQIPFSGGQASISPSPTATTRYRAVVQNGTCASVTSNEFEVEVVSSGIWTGIINSNWNNAGNWCGGVPTASTNVTIPAGTLNNPVINTATAVANNVTVESGASLSFTGTTNVLSIRGNLTVNGIFNTANGTVTYNGTTAQSVAGITYNKLRMNGTGAKSLAGNVTVTSELDLNSGNLQLGANNLTLNASVTMTGGSSSSYVVTDGAGVLTRNSLGATAFTFHTGNGSYTPVMIVNNGTADNISVGILPHCYNSYSGFTGSSPMTQKVVDRTFIVQEATAGGSLLDIQFQWEAADELPSMDRTQMVVGHYSSTWNVVTPAPQNVTGPPYKLTLTGASSLGIFGVGDVNSPMPVTLLSFTAKLNKDVTNLNWITASEVNNSHFEIERATDGANFVKIGEVKGKGNTSRRIEYSFKDRDAGNMLNNTAVLYYRLKQFNFSGEFHYSGMVSVSELKNTKFDVLSTVPNPFSTSTHVNYQTASSAQVDVVVTDAFGKVISTSSVQPEAGANTIEIGADNNWAAGVYFVKLMQDNHVRVVRIVKQ